MTQRSTLPRGDTPIERIIDFRNDPERQLKFLALKRWMKEAAKKPNAAEEAADELAWLLKDYEPYMRLQKMKIKQGAFETVVTCTAEMLENIGKFKLGALAKLPFIMKHRKI